MKEISRTQDFIIVGGVLLPVPLRAPEESRAAPVATEESTTERTQYILIGGVLLPISKGTTEESVIPAPSSSEEWRAG